MLRESLKFPVECQFFRSKFLIRVVLVQDIKRSALDLNMEIAQTWYIVKRNQGNCEILPREQVEGKEDPTIVEKWGPFTSPQEAIARRVGLIRAGKCQPV